MSAGQKTIFPVPPLNVVGKNLIQATIHWTVTYGLLLICKLQQQQASLTCCHANQSGWNSEVICHVQYSPCTMSTYNRNKLKKSVELLTASKFSYHYWETGNTLSTHLNCQNCVLLC